MTNESIICSIALSSGLYDQGQLEEFKSMNQLPPLRTRTGWKSLGYRPRDDASGHKTKLWVPVPMKNESGEDADCPHFKLVNTRLYDESEVEKIMEVIS